MSLLAGLAPAERKLAPRAGTPQWAEPMLATLTSDRFSDAAWIFERKLDGERVVSLRTEGRVRRAAIQSGSPPTATRPGRKAQLGLRRQGRHRIRRVREVTREVTP